MKRKFNIVAQFTETSNKAKDLTNLQIEYAKEKLSLEEGAKFSYSKEKSLEEKAKMINGLYAELIAERSKSTTDDFSGDMEAYSEHIAGYAQAIDKVLLQAVYPYVFDAPLFNALCEIHFGGYGQTFQIDLKDNSLYRVTKLGRRQKHTDVQSREEATVSINTDYYGITTMTTLPKILLGESMEAEEIMVSALSLRAKIYEMVINEFVAKTNTVTISQLMASGAFDEKEWLKRLKVVKAYSGNTLPIIFGNDIAVKTLLPKAQATRIDLQDPYNTTLGYMDFWNRYKVMAFDAVANNDGEFGLTDLPDDAIYGIAPTGRKPIHIAVGQIIKNRDDNRENNDSSIRSTLAQELGVKLVTNDVISIYKDLA